jgi:hypothetical protein
LPPDKHERKQKLNGRRYLLLPDIYTLIDKTSRLGEINTEALHLKKQALSLYTLHLLG